MVDSFLSSRNGLKVAEIGIVVILIGVIALAVLKATGVIAF